MIDDKLDKPDQESTEKKESTRGENTTEEIKAPVSAICEDASANAAAQVDDGSEIKPVEGFFLTSQRWH